MLLMKTSRASGLVRSRMTTGPGDAARRWPPGIHSTYAAHWRLWPHDSVVNAADLAAAALLLVVTGRCATRLD